MRKRIVIGLLAVVVIGVGAFFVSQPKEGSVEWHKRRFGDAQNVSMNWTRYPRWESAYRKWTGTSRPVRTFTQHEMAVLLEQMSTSRRALVKAGYLMERTVMLSNRGPTEIVATITPNRSGIPVSYPNFTAFTHKSNALVIVCAREDMAKWEELIRKADVPDSYGGSPQQQ